MPSSSPPAEAVASGDLVRLDYEIWSESGDRTELVDTTRESVAKKAELAVPAGFTWGPRPRLVGGEYFPAGIENSLVGLAVGEETQREFAPADAFGERDPKLIELFSMHEISRLPEMRREDASLELGTVLTIKGRRGRVVTLTAARVRVDFNPPFAGRKIRATFRVEARITAPTDQARALVDLTYGHGADFGIELHNHVLTLKVPDRSKFDLSWAASKPRVIDRLRTQLKPKSIQVVEEYVTPVSKETKDADAAAPTKDEKADTAEAPAKHAEESAKPAHAAGHAHKPKGD
jgi:FKBP-type peptidyl-prolyl cis-trans isomerase 2